MKKHGKLNNDNFDEEIVPEEEEVSSFRKDDKLHKIKEELSEVKKEKQKYLEDLQRAKADFVNMRRRDEIDKENAIKNASETLIKEILGIVDSFDHAFNYESPKDASNEFRKGIEQIQLQLFSILNKNNVISFGEAGEEFDPAMHEAIGIKETDDKALDHKIESVVQKGYKMNDKIIRSAKVIISQYNEKT